MGLGFIYFLVLSVAMAGMINMPKLIDERVVMKMEVSDGLYHEAAYIISMAIINSFVSLGSNTIFVTIMFLFSGMSFDMFPFVFLWATLVFITFDALFSFIAAIAKTAETAQVTAMPFLLLFVVYNGFTVTKATAPSFMHWVIWISPPAHAMEAISTSMESLTDGLEQQQWHAVNQMYQYEQNTGISAAVYASLIVVFRIGQVVCLKRLNNLEK